MNLAESIGNTPLIELRRVVPAGCGRIFAKIEGQNPSGSMKDRMAYAVVNGALSSGRLSRQGTIVEYTGGSTGTSLALVCAAEGIALTVVTSDAFSIEKRCHMRALGADIVEIPSDGGKTTAELIKRMIARAEELGRSPNTVLADQFNNPDAASGYVPLANEILHQSPAPVDAFVQSVGTAQCIKGVGSTLRQALSNVLVVAVEPAESSVLSGGTPGSHKIEGVGPGFIPPIWSDDLADEIQLVSTDDAMAMARQLARDEGLFAGTSSGANVAAAIRVGTRLGPNSVVATILCDSGLKYVSTSLYARHAEE
ncbi:MAG: PLP-dependent cysteine synthase family protein [Pirellulaceae bacterium]